MQKELIKSIREKNRILNQWEQYYRKEKLQSFPRIIQLPTGTRCNIQCRFCTNRKNGKSADYTNLSYDECYSIIKKGKWEQALRFVESIDLYGWGEPLFNPDYEKIFDYIANNFSGLAINISTNGILFNEKWTEKFLALDKAEVNFSVNAAKGETYRRLTGSNQFENVISNIKRLTGLREKMGKKDLHVSLSYVATIENIRELPQYVNLAAHLKADCIKVQDVMILNEETEKISLINEPELAYEVYKTTEKLASEQKINIFFYIFHNVDYFQDEAGKIKAFDIGNQGTVSKSEEVPSPYVSRTNCFEPWEVFQVCANGDVWPCCRFENLPGTSLGNIYKQSFEDIWNGKAYRYFRATINTNNPPRVCAICPRKAGLD